MSISSDIFLTRVLSLLAPKFYLKHLHKHCKLKLNTRLVFECQEKTNIHEGTVLSRLLPQTTCEKKDSNKYNNWKLKGVEHPTKKRLIHVGNGYDVLIFVQEGQNVFIPQYVFHLW